MSKQTFKPCGCHRCLTESGETVTIGRLTLPITATRMVVCAICGNKRCPHATDHRHACTGSNEPGQPGSRYGKVDWSQARQSLKAEG